MAGDSAIGVFGPEGEYLHGYGRSGGGPQEFHGAPAPMVVRVGEDDLVYVLEGGFLHELTAGAAGHLEKARISLPANDAIVVGTTQLVQWPVRELSGAGAPIQVLSADRRSTHGIGITSARPMTLTSPYDGFRRLGRAHREGRVWSAYVNRYEMSRFRLDGLEELRVSRVVDWFREYEEELPGEMILVPSRPRVEGLLESADGVLWVAVSHADARVRDRSGPNRPVQGEVQVDPDIDFNQLLDTTIEILDTSNGEVLASRTFDAYLRFVNTTDDRALLYALRPLETGDLVVDIYAGTLVGPLQAP
jgi:hypothetical protein